MFAEADTDGSGEIDFDEFVEVVEKGDGGQLAMIVQKLAEDDSLRDIVKQKNRPTEGRAAVLSEQLARVHEERMWMNKLSLLTVADTVAAAKNGYVNDRSIFVNANTGSFFTSSMCPPSLSPRKADNATPRSGAPSRPAGHRHLPRATSGWRQTCSRSFTTSRSRQRSSSISVSNQPARALTPSQCCCRRHPSPPAHAGRGFGASSARPRTSTAKPVARPSPRAAPPRLSRPAAPPPPPNTSERPTSRHLISGRSPPLRTPTPRHTTRPAPDCRPSRRVGTSPLARCAPLLALA